MKKKFPDRELNPGLSGESRVSWPPRLSGRTYAFDRDRTGDLGIMRPTRCQLRHESCLHHISTHNNFILLKFYLFAIIKDSTPAGFEPARAKPNRFLIYRLNHSATVSDRGNQYWKKNKCNAPPVGIEPTATRLRVLRSTIWAMEANIDITSIK